MYSVYHVVLDVSVSSCHKFMARNPHLIGRRVRAGDQRCYYVGSTGQTVDERVGQHYRGELGGNHIVERYGLVSTAGLSYETIGTFRTREEAEQVEKDYARELQRHGHGAWTNIKARR